MKLSCLEWRLAEMWVDTSPRPDRGGTQLELQVQPSGSEEDSEGGELRDPRTISATDQILNFDDALSCPESCPCGRAEQWTGINTTIKTLGSHKFLYSA